MDDEAAVVCGPVPAANATAYLVGSVLMPLSRPVRRAPGARKRIAPRLPGA